LPTNALMWERETIHLITMISERQISETLLWRMSLT
jgi:hypothetical protein